MKRFLAWLLGLTLSGLLVTSSMSLAAEGEWSKRADMPFPRLFFSVSAAGELVYVIGGMLAEPIARGRYLRPSNGHMDTKSRYAICTCRGRYCRC